MNLSNDMSLRTSYDINLPQWFRISLFDDWDLYNGHIKGKLTDNTGLGINVKIYKYLLYSILNEKEKFLAVVRNIYCIADDTHGPVNRPGEVRLSIEDLVYGRY